MKTKKLLSLLLALMMMLSVVPMYASAAQIALKATHVTEWPTASGEMYYGQIIGEHITLSGGKVVYDGEEVPGHFEHVDPEAPAEEASDAYEADIKFVPDDTTTYKGFTKYFSKTTYVVHKTTPILADSTKPPVVATAVEAGTALSAIAISDGSMINPYDTTESSIKKIAWQWVNPDTVVTESGYYDAQFKASAIKYVTLTEKIYVEVEGSVHNTTIAELPSIAEMTYDANRTYADVIFVGGKAIDSITGEEVAGTFAFTNTVINSIIPSVGIHTIDITFTPHNSENYLPAIGNVTVTVNPAKIAFIDSDGTSTIPEITVPYGLKMGDDISGYLKPYLNGTASFNYEETEYYNEYIPVGTHELTVKTICDDPNYERYNTLTFKLTVEPVETAVTVKYDINKDNKNTYEIYVVKADVDGARPQGSFAIYVDGQLLKDGAKYSERITWSPEKSKAYTVKVVYTPTANDPCLVADTEITVDAKLYRNITTVNTSSDGTKQFRCGEKIQVAANVPEFSGWVITDAAGNTVDLGVDLSAKSIELAVPDYDITIEAKGKTSSGSDGLGNIFDMDLGDLTEGDSEWAIINIIRNLIAKFKSFLQQLIETFQSIGG